MNYSKISNGLMAMSCVAMIVIFFMVGYTIGANRSQTLAEEISEETLPNIPMINKVVIWGEYDGQAVPTQDAIDWTVPETFSALDVELDIDIQQFINEIAQLNNIDFTFIMALIEHESGYQANIISSTNDYGLMQINKCNHNWLSEACGVTDFLDPYQNVVAGCYVLHELFEKYEDPAKVLMAYNMGEDGASKLWKQGIYSTGYTRSIFSIQERMTDNGG